MIGLFVGMALAIVVLVLVVGLLAYEIIRGNDRLESDHAMCVARTADVSSNRILAMFARELARRWESVEEKNTLIDIRRRFNPNGPSVTAMWLMQQADEIDPANWPEEEEEEEEEEA